MRATLIRPSAAIPAFIALLALAVLPSLHGPLSHASGPCGELFHTHERCIDGAAHAEAAEALGEPSYVCSICAASRPARSLLHTQGYRHRVPRPPVVLDVAHRTDRIAARTWSPGAPAAPRAPPASV